MPSLLPPPKYSPVTDPMTGYAENAWYDWALRVAREQADGITTSVTLAKITALGSDGSLTIVNGRVTAVVQPT